MTVKDFWESNFKMAIHCSTEKEAEELLKEFDRLGYRWGSGDRYDANETNHYIYGSDTAYSNSGTYGDVQSYKVYGYIILEYDSIVTEANAKRKLISLGVIDECDNIVDEFKHIIVRINNLENDSVDEDELKVGYKDDKIFLPSEMEMNRYRSIIPVFKDWEWTRDKGEKDGFVKYIFRHLNRVSPHGEVPTEEASVRPMIKFTPHGEKVKVGDRIILYSFPWIVIDDGLAIAEIPIGFEKFDDNSNDYETSHVRKFLKEWENSRAM